MLLSKYLSLLHRFLSPTFSFFIFLFGLACPGFLIILWKFLQPINLHYQDLGAKVPLPMRILSEQSLVTLYFVWLFLAFAIVFSYILDIFADKNSKKCIGYILLSERISIILFLSIVSYTIIIFLFFFFAEETMYVNFDTFFRHILQYHSNGL
nr:putative integron gene cassette protein [uncultured bacterium]